jgi:hypothetical protein
VRPLIKPIAHILLEEEDALYKEKEGKVTHFYIDHLIEILRVAVSLLLTLSHSICLV